MSRKLYKSLKAQKDQTEQIKLTIYGSLGIPLGGRKIIQVDGRQGYVYVRLRDNQNEVIQAFNNKVAASYDLPVILVREGGRYVVQQFNSQRYLNNAQNSAPFLPGHGTQHSFPRGGGADITWVYGQQIIPGLVYPESATGTNVMIEKYPLYSSSGRWIYAGGTGTQNILQYRPTTGSSSLMTLVYLDSITGNPGILIGSGTYFPAIITGSVYPYLPSPSNTQIPLAGVLLNTGTTVITWENIYDVRQWVHATPSGTSSGGGVTSVNGYTGVVVLTPADIGAEPTFTIADKAAASAWATGTAYAYGDDVYVDNTSIITYFTCIVPHTSSSNILLDNTKWLYRAANYLVVSDSAYNSALWDGITDIAPSKNAVRDKFVSIDASIAGQLQGVVGQNKGVPLGTGTVLNINGSRLIGSFSGTVLNLSNSPDPYDNIGIYGLSGTTGLGTGTSISFRDGLLASITGTFLYVGVSAKAPMIFGGHGNGGTIPASTTYYLVPYISGLDTVGRSSLVPAAGTIRNLYFRLASAQPASGSLVVEVFGGSAGTTATGVKITIAAGSASATFSDTTHTFAHAAGDLVTIKIINNATGASGVIGSASFEIDTSLI